MNLTDLITVSVIVLALLLQSGSCFFTSRRPLSIGFLNVFLAVLILFVAISLLHAKLVAASDLGAIMVGGKTMAWLLRAALVITSIVPGLCWYRIRVLNRW